MPMPVMDIRHVVVFVLQRGVLMPMRVDSIDGPVPMHGVVMAVTMFMKYSRVDVRVRMLLVDQ